MPDVVHMNADDTAERPKPAAYVPDPVATAAAHGLAVSLPAYQYVRVLDLPPEQLTPDNTSYSVLPEVEPDAAASPSHTARYCFPASGKLDGRTLAALVNKAVHVLTLIVKREVEKAATDGRIASVVVAPGDFRPLDAARKKMQVLTDALGAKGRFVLVGNPRLAARVGEVPGIDIVADPAWTGLSTEHYFDASTPPEKFSDQPGMLLFLHDAPPDGLDFSPIKARYAERHAMETKTDHNGEVCRLVDDYTVQIVSPELAALVTLTGAL